MFQFLIKELPTIDIPKIKNNLIFQVFKHAGNNVIKQSQYPFKPSWGIDLNQFNIIAIYTFTMEL